MNNSGLFFLGRIEKGIGIRCRILYVLWQRYSGKKQSGYRCLCFMKGIDNKNKKGRQRA